MNSALTNLHHSLTNVDLGETGAHLITKVLLDQVSEIEHQFEEGGTNCEADLLNALKLTEGVAEGARTVQAYILYFIRKHWDNLSLSFRKEYANNFDALVLRVAKVQPSTMDRYLSAIETFFISEKKPSTAIRTVVRDQFKNPVRDASGAPKVEYRDFDPTEVPITKLVAALPLVNRGDMNEKQWSALMDSSVTVEKLQEELYKTSNPSTDPDQSLRFFLEGDIITASEYGQRIEIGEIFWQMGEESEVGRNAIYSLLSRLGIKHDKDVIAQKMKDARNVVLHRVFEDVYKESVNGDYPNE